MRFASLCFTLAVAGSLTAGPARAQVASVPDGELAVVHITGIYSCSAFLVRPATFLTAKHCVQNPGPAAQLATITVDADRGANLVPKLSPSRVWTAPGAWTNDFDIDGHDFGVIQMAENFSASVPGVTPLRIYGGDPASLVGEEVELIGFGFHDGNYSRKRSSSRISAVGVTIAVKPAVACPGDSGGVLLLKKTREAIGIASREWPVGSDPCSDPAKVTGYRTPEATYFQRIDVHAALIDTPPPPKEEAAPASVGCSVGTPTSSPSFAWALAACATAVATRRRRRRAL